MASRATTADVSPDAGAKMAAKLEAHRREEEDKRAASAWNECFKDKANLRDPKVMEKFWTEVKDRLMRRYGTMGEAYSVISKGEDDCSLTFAQFGEILKMANVVMEPRICRALFEKAANGERTLGIEQLKELLMQRTLLKLRSVMEGCNGRQERVQNHVGAFLRRMMLEDATIASRAVDRFQRKLTVDFIRQFWKLTLAHLGKPPAPDILLDRVAFRRVTKKAVGSGLHAYDANFMLRLYNRIERLSQCVAVCDVMTTLLLLSPEGDRCKKVALLFEFFDVDYDGCLVWDQLSAMFKCLCKQRPIAQATDLVTEDLAFQEELSTQEGLHAYEQTRWHLQRGTNLEGEIVSLRELWIALRKQDNLMATLLPGSIPIGSWSHDPTEGEDQIDEVVEEKVTVQSTLTSETKSMTSRAPRRTMAGESGRLATGGNVTHFARSGVRHIPPAYRELRIEDAGEIDFKGQRTKKFQESLQGFGHIRLAEFTKGWLTPTVGQLEGQVEQGHPGPPPTPASLGMPSPGNTGMSRVATAPGGLTPMPRPPPSPGSPGSPQRGKAGASRLASPSGHGGGGGGHAATGGALGGVDRPHFRDLPGIAPTMRTQRWGQESVDRFRLFAAMKGGMAHHKLLTPDKGVSFMCQLCQRPHTFNTDCARR